MAHLLQDWVTPATSAPGLGGSASLHGCCNNATVLQRAMMLQRATAQIFSVQDQLSELQLNASYRSLLWWGGVLA